MRENKNDLASKIFNIFRNTPSQRKEISLLVSLVSNYKIERKLICSIGVSDRVTLQNRIFKFFILFMNIMSSQKKIHKRRNGRTY
jgi:hypothetical protein